MRSTTACAVQVSVIICNVQPTSASRDDARQLERLDVPTGVSWELIVVDNNSTDGTDSMIAVFEQRCTLPLMHLVERRRGKSIALKRPFSTHGVKSLRLRTMTVSSIRAGSGRSCGNSKPIPHWVVWAGEWNSTTAPITSSPQDSAAQQLYRPLERLALIFGCNMALSRQALRDTGEFDPWLGPGSRCRWGRRRSSLSRSQDGSQDRLRTDLVVYHNHGRSLLGCQGVGAGVWCVDGCAVL